jgi:hypothetical protein
VIAGIIVIFRLWARRDTPRIFWTCRGSIAPAQPS